MNSSTFLNQDDLIDAAQGVLSAMLGLSVEASAPEAGWPGEGPHQAVLANVAICGDWDGVLLLSCNRSTACFLAGEMFGSDASLRVDDDVKDALGEIANMIAGDLKERLPGQSVLHLPCVIEGSDYAVTIKGGHTILSLLFSTGEHQMLLSVVQSDSLKMDLAGESESRVTSSTCPPETFGSH